MAVLKKDKPANLDIQIWASDMGATQFPTQPKYDTGWEFEVPIDKEENFIQNQQDQAIANANQMGVMDWDVTTTYFKNSWVTYYDGASVLKYVSLTDSNEGNTPVDPVSADWSRIDNASSLAQTMADSNLSSVTLDGSSLVAAIDLSNVTDLSGNDPALQTLANKIGNDSGLVKDDQLLKTNASGETRVNGILAGSTNYSTHAVFASSAVGTADPSTGEIGGNSSFGLSLLGSGTTGDVTLFNKDGSSVFSVSTGTRNTVATGKSIWHETDDASIPSGSVLGQIYGSSTQGLVLSGAGSTNALQIKNNAGTLVAVVERNTANFYYSGISVYRNSTFSPPSVTSTGVINGNTTDGLMLAGFGSSNDFRLRARGGGTVSMIIANTSFLSAGQVVVNTDSSAKYATTSMVHSVVDKTAPTFDQVISNDNSNQAPVQTFNIATFNLGHTGKALIEATWVLRSKGNGTTSLRFTISYSGTTQQNQVLSGSSGDFYTVTLQREVSGSAFANISTAFTEISLVSGSVNELDLITKNYKVTPY